MIYENFILEIWYRHCPVIAEMKIKKPVSLKSVASKKTRSWRLKKKLKATVKFNKM